MPCHAMPCHAMPCHAMTCHTISYHIIPYHTIPYHTIPYHTIPYHATPCHATPRHAMPHHAMQYCTLYQLPNPTRSQERLCRTSQASKRVYVIYMHKHDKLAKNYLEICMYIRIKLRIIVNIL